MNETTKGVYIFQKAKADFTTKVDGTAGMTFYKIDLESPSGKKFTIPCTKEVYAKLLDAKQGYKALFTLELEGRTIRAESKKRTMYDMNYVSVKAIDI